MAQISVNIGDGLTFDGNKITTDWSDGYISKEPDGLYVPDLTGPDGTGGGTKVDNYTIIETTKNRVKTNRKVVQYIFSMCAWKVTSTGPSTSGYSVSSGSVLKDLSDFKDEVNRVVKSDNYTSYNIIAGDLIMFRYHAHPINGSSRGWSKTIDDGNRYPADTCVALFVVNSVSGTSYGAAQYINSVELECLWCRSDVTEMGGAFGWKAGSILTNRP